ENVERSMASENAMLGSTFQTKARQLRQLRIGSRACPKGLAFAQRSRATFPRCKTLSRVPCALSKRLTIPPIKLKRLSDRSSALTRNLFATALILLLRKQAALAVLGA